MHSDMFVKYMGQDPNGDGHQISAVIIKVTNTRTSEVCPTERALWMCIPEMMAGDPRHWGGTG